MKLTMLFEINNVVLFLILTENSPRKSYPVKVIL